MVLETRTLRPSRSLAYTSNKPGSGALALALLVTMLAACEPSSREGTPDTSPRPGTPPDSTPPDSPPDILPDEGMPPPSTDPELHELFDESVRGGFRGALLVERHGVRQIAQGAGTLSESSARTPDSDTAFDCGSIMKDVTGATLFLLEEDGLLSRQQTLGDFFSEVPSVWRSVTLDLVLAHSAGFDEYHDTEGDFEPMDRGTALQRIFAQEPLFEPGTDSAYSNSGYTLLAAVIEEATGEDYRDVVRQRIFAPLGMTRSGFYGDPLWGDGNVAVGSGADVFAGNDPSRWPGPTWALIGNGGLVSTLEDLLRLARAFDTDVLFEPGTREAWRRGQPQGEIAGHAIIGYAGGNDFGFNAVVGQVASDSTYVIAASHVEASINAEVLAGDVLEALYDVELEVPDEE